MANSKKLELLKSCIDKSILPTGEEVTYDQLKSLIVHGQCFAQLESELSNPAALAKFGNKDTIFTPKKLDISFEWSWAVDCDVCAICRNDVMDSCMRCQAENSDKICAIGNKMSNLSKIRLFSMGRV